LEGQEGGVTHHLPLSATGLDGGATADPEAGGTPVLGIELTATPEIEQADQEEQEDKPPQQWLRQDT